MTTKDNPLTELSEAMVAAVEKAGAATLLVDARKRFPASGIAITPDLVLTANHVVERDEDIHVILPDGAELSPARRPRSRQRPGRPAPGAPRGFPG